MTGRARLVRRSGWLTRAIVRAGRSSVPRRFAAGRQDRARRPGAPHTPGRIRCPSGAPLRDCHPSAGGLYRHHRRRSRGTGRAGGHCPGHHWSRRGLDAAEQNGAIEAVVSVGAVPSAVQGWCGGKVCASVQQRRLGLGAGGEGADEGHRRRVAAPMTLLPLGAGAAAGQQAHEPIEPPDPTVQSVTLGGSEPAAPVHQVNPSCPRCGRPVRPAATG